MAELPPGAVRWSVRQFHDAPVRLVSVVVAIAALTFWLIPFYIGIALIVGVFLLGRAMDSKGLLTNGAKLFGALVIVAVVGSMSIYTVDVLAPMFGVGGTSNAEATEPEPQPTQLEPSPSREPSGSSQSPDEPTSSSPGSPPGTALTLLGALEVKGRSAKTGYDRAAFGQAWLDVDRNGCDTRNDILRRDLENVVLKPDSNGCAVLSGTLDDPFTGHHLKFERGVNTSLEVQIDHVVALSDAWQKGASTWPTRRLAKFANDPLELLAVDGPSNASKSDGDAATWLPPAKAFRCKYVALQVAVKAKYELWVTRAEGDAIARVLEACPAEPVPVPEPIVLGR